MNAQRSDHRDSGRPSRRKWRILSSVLLLIAATLLLAIITRVIDPGFSRLGLYNPERDSLVDAQWQLVHVASVGDSAQDARASEHIRRVLQALNKAQAEHPESRRRIGGIREQLVQLQLDERRAQQQAAKRSVLYHQIIDRLDNLVSGTHSAAALSRIAQAGQGQANGQTDG